MSNSLEVSERKLNNNKSTHRAAEATVYIYSHKTENASFLYLLYTHISHNFLFCKHKSCCKTFSQLNEEWEENKKQYNWSFAVSREVFLSVSRKCAFRVCLMLPFYYLNWNCSRSKMEGRNKTRSASFLIKTLQFFIPQKPW